MGVLQIEQDCHFQANEIAAPLNRAEESLLFDDILGLIDQLRSRAAHHAARCSVDEATMFENEGAVRWINGVLEDVAATVLGVSRSASRSDSLLAPGKQDWRPLRLLEEAKAAPSVPMRPQGA